MGASPRCPERPEDTSLLSLPLLVQLTAVGQTNTVENKNQLYAFSAHY